MDRIGNLNTASNILNWNYDTRRPTATLTTVSPVATRLAGTGSFTVSFPETITGLTPAKFSSSGGTITSITGAASPYTVVFTPTPLVNSGAISITFPAGSITDAVGLTNTASNTLTWIYDTLPPTLTLAGTGAIALSNQANYALSGSCSENGRTINITLESVNTSALCVAGNWSRTFSTAGAIDGIIPLTITLSDAVGNTTTVSNTVIKDTTIPTVSINPLVAVNQSNSTNYSYSGNCSENSIPVSMRFTDGTTTYAGTGTCTGGTYSGAINLSLLTE